MGVSHPVPAAPMVATAAHSQESLRVLAKPLCPPDYHPSSDPIIIASLSSAPWHVIGRLPEVQGNKPIKKAFKAYPIGFFHIDIAEVQTAEGKLYLFVAIDRTSKFAFTELHVKATTRTAADFLRALVKAVPYKIHTVLTDNGIHFTTSPIPRAKPGPQSRSAR